MSEEKIRKACADSGHKQGGGRLGETCVPCMEYENRRLRAALRIKESEMLALGRDRNEARAELAALKTELVTAGDIIFAQKLKLAAPGNASEMRRALEACDKAFVSWQVGQIPGRPEDILDLIVQVRSAIASAPSPAKEANHRWVGSGEYGDSTHGSMCGDCGKEDDGHDDAAPCPAKAPVPSLREALEWAANALSHCQDETSCCYEDCEACAAIQNNPKWKKWREDSYAPIDDALASPAPSEELSEEEESDLAILERPNSGPVQNRVAALAAPPPRKEVSREGQRD